MHNTVLLTVTLEPSTSDGDFFDGDDAPAVSSDGECLTCMIPMARVKKIIEDLAPAFNNKDITSVNLSPQAGSALLSDAVFLDESEPFPLSLLGDFSLTEVKISAICQNDNGKVYKLFGTWTSRDGRMIRAEARCELPR